MRSPLATAVLVIAPLLGAGWAQGADAPKGFTLEQLDFFEKQVRPLLAANCLSCHGPQKQEGGLRLDTREAVLQGETAARQRSPEMPRRAGWCRLSAGKPT